MDITAYRDEIRLKLTGFMLDLELDDITLDRIIESCLREVQRYISSTKLITVPFSRCIDLSTIKDEEGKDIKVNSVSAVYRTDATFNGDIKNDNTSLVDPMSVAQWQLISGTGNMYNFQDYMYNYAAWNTLSQIRNITSTDLFFKYDKASNKLYINISTGNPVNVTIEYVPRYDNVDEIVSDYWIDVLMKMSVATAKIVVGRIRSRYKQSNAIWSQDGDQILQEGLAELNAIREHLKNNTNLFYPID